MFLIFYADLRGEGVEVSLNFFPVSRKSDFFYASSGRVGRFRFT